jgi:hypothetical protein
MAVKMKECAKLRDIRKQRQGKEFVSSLFLCNTRLLTTQNRFRGFQGNAEKTGNKQCNAESIVCLNLFVRFNPYNSLKFTKGWNKRLCNNVKTLLILEFF